MTIVAAAILQQTDKILVKPANVTSLVDVIKQRVASGPQQKRVIESVASTLETRDYQHHSGVACMKADRPIGRARRQVVTGSRTFRRWGNPRDPIGWVQYCASSNPWFYKRGALYSSVAV